MDSKANDKPEQKTTRKAVVTKKARYFVPALGRSVEASSLDEVAEIVKKETSPRKRKGNK